MPEFPLNLMPVLDKLLPVLEENAGANPHDFALSFSKEQNGIRAADAAHLLDCYQRVGHKFPGIHQPGMLYTRTAIEQSTGEALIRFKTGRFSGENATDLTGGLGMDTIFLSRCFNQVLYLERNPVLTETAAHNHRVLGLSNVRHLNQDAETWLQHYSGPAFDLIYIDPSRRDEKHRVFLLKDCEPDVRQLLPGLKRISKKLLIKLSPLYDITQLKRELAGITNIYVISVDGEVKEILALIESETKNPTIDCQIHAVLLDKTGNILTEIQYEVNHPDDCQIADMPGRYLYEPDAAIIKAGLSARYAASAGLCRLNYNTDYLTGDADIPDFPGKKFRISETLTYKPRIIKKFLQKERLKGVRIHKRDFPLQPEQLYKTFGLKMGEQADLFFTKNADGELILITAQRG